MTGKESYFLTENTPAASVHWIQVKVDPETGQIKPLKFLLIQVIGFALDPIIVEGQVQAGLIQGLVGDYVKVWSLINKGWYLIQV